MSPKISIIVPVYNVEAYLNKCIDSILAQTFTDYELILVNDGSSDNSGKICNEYAKEDKRIRVMQKGNGGVSSARNAGLDIAKGEYIGFVDSDDYIDPKMYEILYNQATKHNSDIIASDFTKVNEFDSPLLGEEDEVSNSNVLQFTNYQALNQMYIVSNNYYNNGFGNNVIWSFMWNKLIRRTLFYDLKFCEDMIYEDEIISHQLLFKCKNITYVPAKLYYYKQRDSSLVHAPFGVKKFDKVYALKERADFFNQKGLRELHYMALNCYIEVLFWNYSAAEKELLNAKQDLKRLKSSLMNSLMHIIKSPLVGWKKKLFITLFIINPYVLTIAQKNQ